MRYQISFSHKFWKSPKKLRSYYSKQEYKEIIEEIKESILTLANSGELPIEYNDHVLMKTPFVGFHEYHLYDDNILVIYSRLNNKTRFHYVEVTNHESLRNRK